MQMHITLFFSSSSRDSCRARGHTGGSIRRKRADPTSVDLGRHGPLKKLDGNHQPAFPSYIVQNSLNSSQGPSLDQNFVPQFQKWPRHHEQSGLYHPADALDFVVRYGSGDLSEANQIHHSRRRQHRQPVQGIQPAEYVTRKEKLVHFFFSIGPAALSLAGWREFLVPSFSQMRRRDAFVIGANPDCKPWIARTIYSGFSIAADRLKKYLRDHGTPRLGFQQAL